MALCNVCFRNCHIEEGNTGFCFARRCVNGKVVCDAYGRLTGIALDPIEKKPLYHFHPGSRILSVGSYGCNLSCPFCQNYEISLAGERGDKGTVLLSTEDTSSGCFAATFPSRGRHSSTAQDSDRGSGTLSGSSGVDTVNAVKPDIVPDPLSEPDYRTLSPEALVALAQNAIPKDNIGIAFTYNEPLVAYEYVRDTARLSHEAGLQNVLVTAGTASEEVLDELLPYIDAMNIDLKSWNEKVYQKTLHGNLAQTKRFIEKAAAHCHVELTTLIVPGLNDAEEEIRSMTAWIASLNGGKGRGIPYHVSRFFPMNRMTDVPPTPVDTVYHLADVARENLLHVYTGNC